MERKVTPYTCLTYMTTGCLLENLVVTKNLENFTHIIIDEVHERDQDTDLLLMVVRKFMRITGNYTKVILMSATADASKFSTYFRSASVATGSFVNAPIIEIATGQPYAVREYHLDDLKKLDVSYIAELCDVVLQSLLPVCLKKYILFFFFF